jgi:hypothetical protein
MSKVMHEKTEAKVRELRERTLAQLAILAELENTFTQPSMKEWVRRARVGFKDVESIFLSRLDDGSHRNVSQEAQVISSGELAFWLAAPQSKRLHDALASHGPNAMLLEF